MEGRDAAEGKSAQRPVPRAQDRSQVLMILERIGERAAENKQERFVNLLSHIKVPLLKEAYYALERNAAAGVDGETWRGYQEHLDERLLDLQDRIQSGRYRPEPVRRVLIPKGDGRTRPLGIPTLEDKIVQQAVRMLLEPIYERSEFKGCSYGFRPGRSQHDALDSLAVALQRMTNWVLDADLQSFFDTIDHEWMQKFLEHRIGDRRLVELVMRWLRAGVLVDGRIEGTGQGTPQGGVISPLLANIYLHYALDLWVLSWRKKHACGEMYYVRYADDFVMGFQYERDAREMREALAERLSKFGLKLHPDKTQVIRFGRYARRDCVKDGLRRPKTFDFLGFTHICAEIPGKGGFRLVRRTARKKREAKLAEIRKEIRKRMHNPVGQQYQWLASVLRGHYRYYGVPGNSKALASFAHKIKEAWHRRLQRRSQTARWSARERRRFEQRYPLPEPRLHHPNPVERFKQRSVR
jgi:group II intron reverse transcriptase/maturase